MRRVLILNYEYPPLGGGGGVAAKVLAKGFIQNGYEVDYLTSWYPGLERFEVVDGINVHRVLVWGRKELATATMLSLVSFPFLALRQGIRLCRSNKYEFINTHFVIPTGPLGYVLSGLFHTRNILSIHGGDIYDPTKKSSPHRHWYLRVVVRFLLNRADRVVAQSTNTRDNAIAHYQPHREIEIIPLPYELFEFRPANRAELSLEEGIFYTISVGRLIKRKGFDFLIRGIAAISDLTVHALIIGDGPEKEQLQQLAHELGVSNRIHFLGAVSEVKKFQYLSNANVYVLSSLHEGFAIVLQEAMQVSLPIIARKNGGQLDLIQEGESGHLIDGTIQDLAAKIAMVQKSNLKPKSDMSKFKPEGIARAYANL